MQKSMSVALLAGCFLAVGPVGQTQNRPESLTPGELYKKVAPSVVLLEMHDEGGKPIKRGTGFLVSADGRIVTNFHVIAHSKSGSVRLANGDIYDRIMVVDFDKRRDLAIIKIPAVDQPSLSLGRSSGVEVGESIFVVSNVLGELTNTLSHGLVSGKRPLEGFTVFQLNAAISEGSSGAPVFNSRGEVIGVALATLPGEQSINFAIPIDYVRGMLASQKLQSLAEIYEPAPQTTESARAEKASEVQTNVSANPGPASPSPSDELRRMAALYLEKHLYKWRLEDARKELGEPVRERPAFSSGKVTGTIYAFPDPTRYFLEYELTFSSATGVLTMIIVYPQNAKLSEARQRWGTNYAIQRAPNGERMLMYRNRRLMVRVDKDDRVISFGIY